MSLQRRRERFLIIFVWKIRNNFYPNVLNLKFDTNRRSGAIKVVLKPLPRVTGRLLTVYEESFLIVAAKLWNVIPANLTHISSVDHFQIHLDNFLRTIPDKPPLPGYAYQNNNSLLKQCC